MVLVVVRHLFANSFLVSIIESPLLFLHFVFTPFLPFFADTFLWRKNKKAGHKPALRAK
jgi:hypothetical protein